MEEERRAAGRRGWGLRAFWATARGPPCFTDKRLGPPEAELRQIQAWASSTEAPTFPRTPGKWRRRGVDDGVRPAAEGTRGVGCGAIYRSHNRGDPEREFPRVPASLLVTTEPPKAAEALGRVWELGRPSTPCCHPPWQGPPPLLPSGRAAEEGGSCVMF